MASFTYHKKPNGTTYVYRQESYWCKEKQAPRTKQVCIGKLGEEGKIIYNKRFSDPFALEALEKGEQVTESVLTGQSLMLDKAASASGLSSVVRDCFGTGVSAWLMSLAYSIIALDGKMYHAPVWIEQNDCPLYGTDVTSQEISRVLASVTQGQIEDFLRMWMEHRHKGTKEQYCFDVTSVSSHNTTNPFVEYGYNRDREKLAQINLAVLTGVTSGIPSYYEVLPGSMSDVKTIRSFIERMKKYGIGRIRMLLDRGFYSANNISYLLDGQMSFLIPYPANVGAAQGLIDTYRDALEMPEHILSVTDDRKDAVYGMTVLEKIEGKRVWQHIYYDTARRTEHILSFFANLSTWEEELTTGETKESNKGAYERYFMVKTTPKRGRQVKRIQEAINSYKTDRAGYWVILTNCEKDATEALAAYRKRSRAESVFDDLKNDLDMTRLRTHNSDTMRGRVLIQFLALVITSQVRMTLSDAWEKRLEYPKNVRLSRRYSLSELMLRLGSYRKTCFSGRYGEVVSTPTKAQREIFTAFGIEKIFS
jgi:transposase